MKWRRSRRRGGAPEAIHLVEAVDDMRHVPQLEPREKVDRTCSPRVPRGPRVALLPCQLRIPPAAGLNGHDEASRAEVAGAY